MSTKMKLMPAALSLMTEWQKMAPSEQGAAARLMTRGVSLMVPFMPEDLGREVATIFSDESTDLQQKIKILTDRPEVTEALEKIVSKKRAENDMSIRAQDTEIFVACPRCDTVFIPGPYQVNE